MTKRDRVMHPDVKTPENLRIDIRDYINPIIKQKLFVVVFCLTAMITALVLTYVTSEKYTTATTIFYRPVETTLLRHKTTAVFGSPVPAIPFSTIMQTLHDAASNERVLRPIVMDFNLDRQVVSASNTWYESLYQKFKSYVKSKIEDAWMILKYGRIIHEPPVEKAIIKLRENIDIKGTKDSFIYILTIKDKFPERAAMIVDAVAQKLVEWLRETSLGPVKKNRSRLKKHLAEKEAEIIKLREEKAKTLNTSHFVSLTEETTRGVANFYDMQLDLVRRNAQIEQMQKRTNEIEKELQKTNQSFVQTNDFQKMSSDKLFEKIELKALLAGKKQLQKNIRQLESQLKKLPDLQKKIDELDMRISAETRAHDQFMDLYTETYAQIMTSQKEISVLHSAVIPSKPSQPIKVYHVGLAAFLSFMFSIAVAYVLDYLNIQLFFSAPSSDTASKKQQCLNVSSNSHQEETYSSNARAGAESGNFLWICIISGTAAVLLSGMIYYFMNKIGY